MKKMSIRLAALVLPVLVSSVGLAGQQLGDNATLLLPAGILKNSRQVIVIKGAPEAAATKVGSCGADLHFQPADLVDRMPPARGGGAPGAPPAGGAAGAPPAGAPAGGQGGGRGGAQMELQPTVATKVAIVIPGVTGFKEMKVGWHMGKLGDKGKCGPGYDIYLAHIIATE